MYACSSACTQQNNEADSMHEIGHGDRAWLACYAGPLAELYAAFLEAKGVPEAGVLVDVKAHAQGNDAAHTAAALAAALPGLAPDILSMVTAACQ